VKRTYEDPDEVCNRGDDIQDMMDTEGWKILVADLKDQRVRLRESLESINTIEEVRRIQGKIDEIKHIFGRVDEFVDLAKEIRKQREED